jgi:hypothetical protein
MESIPGLLKSLKIPAQEVEHKANAFSPVNYSKMVLAMCTYLLMETVGMGRCSLFYLIQHLRGKKHISTLVALYLTVLFFGDNFLR